LVTTRPGLFGQLPPARPPSITESEEAYVLGLARWSLKGDQTQSHVNMPTGAMVGHLKKSSDGLPLVAMVSSCFGLQPGDSQLKKRHWGKEKFRSIEAAG